MGSYDEIEIEDMKWDEKLLAYTYTCPCGDFFQITMDELRSGEEIAHCPSCSLFITVVYDPPVPALTVPIPALPQPFSSSSKPFPEPTAPLPSPSLSVRAPSSSQQRGPHRHGRHDLCGELDFSPSRSRADRDPCICDRGPERPAHLSTSASFAVPIPSPSKPKAQQQQQVPSVDAPTSSRAAAREADSWGSATPQDEAPWGEARQTTGARGDALHTRHSPTHPPLSSWPACPVARSVSCHPGQPFFQNHPLTTTTTNTTNTPATTRSGHSTTTTTTSMTPATRRSAPRSMIANTPQDSDAHRRVTTIV
ncbi:MAG: hypothetical protein WDW38_007527 [Sanguina aurantia]